MPVDLFFSFCLCLSVCFLLQLYFKKFIFYKLPFSSFKQPSHLGRVLTKTSKIWSDVVYFCFILFFISFVCFPFCEATVRGNQVISSNLNFYSFFSLFFKTLNHSALNAYEFTRRISGSTTRVLIEYAVWMKISAHTNFVDFYDRFTNKCRVLRLTLCFCFLKNYFVLLLNLNWQLNFWK